MKLTELELRKSQLSYFLGKVVTIVTNDSNISYDMMDPRGAYLHQKIFGGICEGFDEYGIWLLDPEQEVKSFFFYRQVQGIAENPQRPASDPLIQKAIGSAKPIVKETDQVIFGEGDGTTHAMDELTMDALQRMIADGHKK